MDETAREALREAAARIDVRGAFNERVREVVRAELAEDRRALAARLRVEQAQWNKLAQEFVGAPGGKMAADAAAIVSSIADALEADR